MKLRQRKCQCGTWFLPRSSFQRACSPRCALEVAHRDAVQRARKETRIARERLKTRSQWLREAQAAFNAYIRERDADQPCISCDKPATWRGQWHASHYRPAGKCSELRFDENNVHKSCSECNNFKSGNLVEYRPRLLKRIGQKEVDRLEQTYQPKRWMIEELKEIRQAYRRKLRELRREAA